jgi:hypothetical protein
MKSMQLHRTIPALHNVALGAIVPVVGHELVGYKRTLRVAEQETADDRT